MPAWQRITLVAAGAGAGIAATFNTPIGGVMFAVELMLPEVSARTFLPVALATGAATFVGRMFFGWHLAFKRGWRSPVAIVFDVARAHGWRSADNPAACRPSSTSRPTGRSRQPPPVNRLGDAPAAFARLRQSASMSALALELRS